MSDYDHTRHSREFPQSRFDAGAGGSSLLWVLGAIAVLGLVVLIGSLGGGTTAPDHPGGAGAEPVIVAPEEPVDPAAAGGTVTIVE